MQITAKKLLPKALLLSVITAFALSASLPTPTQAFPGMQQEQGAAQAAPQAAPQETLSGKVVETMNVAGYTYVCLENSGNKTWAAVPQTAVKIGDQVAINGGMPMQNFTSKTLNHTFDVIYFGKNLSPVTAKK
jgi:hypothetical protein